MMKPLSLSLFFMALVAGSPLGERSLFSRHDSGVPLNNARRFILRSDLQAPPACASGVNLPSPVSTIPAAADPTSVPGIPDTNSTTTDIPSANVTDTGADPSATDVLNSTDSSIPTATDTASDPVDTSLSRRFAQLDLADLAFTWQDLCLSSGGDIFTNDPCVHFDGISALLANADPCDQQNIADAMIDFAKSEGVVNSEDLIAFAIQYRRYPRNALNILGFVPSTPYCLIAPNNAELVGVWNDQLDGVVPGLYGGPDFPVVAFGADGSCPFGYAPDVSTCSCVSSDGSDTSGVDTGITDGSLNGTDTSLNSTIGETGDDGTDSTETGSLDTGDGLNSTDTGVTADGNSTDTSASQDSGDDTSSSDAASDSEGDGTTSSDTGDASTDTSTDTADDTSATATDAAAQDTSAATDTATAAGNTGTPNINDPNGR